MPKYQVLLADSVMEYLDHLDKGERDRIMKRLDLLEAQPHSAGEPRGKFWIMKVGKAGYRIAFRILEEEKIVRVTNIAQRTSRQYREFYR